jgi:pilus assembly protein Flp/PilA
MELFALARYDARHLIGRFLADACGATAIEYSMVAAGIGLAVSVAIWTLGSTIQTTFYDKLANLF